MRICLNQVGLWAYLQVTALIVSISVRKPSLKVDYTVPECGPWIV